MKLAKLSGCGRRKRPVLDMRKASEAIRNAAVFFKTYINLKNGAVMVNACANSDEVTIRF